MKTTLDKLRVGKDAIIAEINCEDTALSTFDTELVQEFLWKFALEVMN